VLEVDGPLFAGPQTPEQHHDQWGIPPFYIDRGCPVGESIVKGSSAEHEPTEVQGKDGSSNFNFMAPATARNACRVLRALQLRKAVLLEGSPGVGKTSLIAGLAAATGGSSLN
jgi:midasin